MFYNFNLKNTRTSFMMEIDADPHVVNTHLKNFANAVINGSEPTFDKYYWTIYLQRKGLSAMLLSYAQRPSQAFQIEFVKGV